MKFEEWLKDNRDKKYSDILQEVFQFEDQKLFSDWCRKQRLDEFSGADCAMLAISLLDDRVRELEGVKKKKDKEK